MISLRFRWRIARSKFSQPSPPNRFLSLLLSIVTALYLEEERRSCHLLSVLRCAQAGAISHVVALEVEAR